MSQSAGRKVKLVYFNVMSQRELESVGDEQGGKLIVVCPTDPPAAAVDSGMDLVGGKCSKNML